MNDLSKQQLVLLALLVSFVTSLATGIVTVSLMDQAPGGVTRTVTQVIQRTVAGAVPAETNPAAVSIAVDDQVANATAAVVPSIVRIRDGVAGPIVGLGLVVNSQGTIMADKNIIDGINYPEAIFSDGTSTPLSVVRFQIDGDLAFLAPTIPLRASVTPVKFAEAARLGSTVWSLTGTSTYTLSQGIVSELTPVRSANGRDVVSIVNTSIPVKKVMSGAPLFDAFGAVVGIETKTTANPAGASFYPILGARGAIPR